MTSHSQNWFKTLTVFIAPLIALVFSLSYFIVKSDDFLTSQTKEAPKNVALPEILTGQKYLQEIHSDHNGLKKISLLMATFRRTNHSNVFISLLDSEENVISKWQLKGSLIRDNDFQTLVLDDSIPDSKDKTYYLSITSDAVAGNGITVWSSNKHGANGLSLNGSDVSKTLCFRLVYRHPYSELFSRSNGFHVMVLITIAYLLFALLPRLSRVRIESAFLIFWILLSSMYLFSATPFQVPDEQGHFFRSYEISYGHMKSEFNEKSGGGGRELPSGVRNFTLLKNNWQSFSDNRGLDVGNDMVFIRFNSEALYSPVSYMPQSIGIFVARHLTTNLAAIVYSGRLFSWIYVTLLLYAAIRIIPVGKEILALIALMPMNIHEAVSLASDGQIVAVSMLMIAIVIFLRHVSTERMKVWQYVLLYFLALEISLLKIVYLPFILLYLLIPVSCFGSRKSKWWHIAAIVMLSVASNLIWLKTCSEFLSHSRIGADTGAQIEYLIYHPFNYAVVLARTLFNFGASFLETMVGSRLAWLNVVTVSILIQFYICVLAYKFIVNRTKINVSGVLENVLFGVIVSSVIILVATSLYVHWSPVYSNQVDGIQGRYFISLLLPLYFTINNSKVLMLSGNKTNTVSISIASFICCINVCACISLLFFCMVL